MGSLRGFWLLRRPLPLLVTSLVLSGVLGSSSGAALCDVTCCSVLPTCDNARVVTCDCPDMDTIILREGDIPETARAVNIINIRHVTVDKDAINGLQFLTNFTLNVIDKLEIKQDGMASQKESELRSVTFQNIGSLQVKSKAFSGVWQPKTTIRMHHIGGLYVESNAFDYQVTELGPSVSLQHVQMLDLKPNGFSAAIFELNFFNVTMNVCHYESFGGKTMNTELNNVTIAEANARCFYGLNDFSTFNIRSLNMQTVNPQAFSGRMRELIIKDSHFTTMDEKSFDLRLTSMELSTSFIGEWRSKGLSVLASDTLRIDTVRVEYLRKNALVGLQMEQNPKDEFDQPLVIRKLELIETDNGSLTFSECTKVRLTDLDLMAPWPRICPTETWTQALSGGGVSGQLTPAQYQLFFQLFQRRLCYEDGWRKFPISVERPNCSARNERGVGSQASHDSPLDDGKDNVLREETMDAPTPVETRASLALPALPASSAQGDVSPKGRDAVDAADRDRLLPSGADDTGSAGSASGARVSSSGGAASSHPAAASVAASDEMNLNDKNAGRKVGGLESYNSPAGGVVIDVSRTLEMTFSTSEARKADASHESEDKQTASDEFEDKQAASDESEEEATSLESQNPYPAESWIEDDNAGPHMFDNGGKDVHRIPEDSWPVKVPAFEPPNKTRDSLVDALRYRVSPESSFIADAQASVGHGWLPPKHRRTRIFALVSPAPSAPSASPASPASLASLAFSGVQQRSDSIPGHVQQQLLLYMAVGVVLTLVAVLAVLLLLLMLRKPASDPLLAQDTLTEVVAELVRDNHYKESGCSRLQTGKTGGSFYGFGTPSVGCHQYESIRDDHQSPQSNKGVWTGANFQ